MAFSASVTQSLPVIQTQPSLNCSFSALHILGLSLETKLRESSGLQCFKNSISVNHLDTNFQTASFDHIPLFLLHHKHSWSVCEFHLISVTSAAWM